ncbi:MAG: hypothetical protein Kow0047_34680 [Anaerolineae bacterium]
MDPQVRRLLASTRLHVSDTAYALVRLSPTDTVSVMQALCAMEPDRILSVIRVASELTLWIEERAWGALSDRWPRAHVESGWRLITLEQSIGLDVSGYLAPLAAALAEAGVPTMVLSAFSTDHILVQEAHLERALGSLQAVIDACAQGGD